MRSRKAARVYASRLLCLGVASIVLVFAGCGGNSSGSDGGGSTTTVTSVTDSCKPDTLNSGQVSSCTASVEGQGSPSQAVTWTVSSSTAGTITTAGAFTASSTITTATTATIKACSTLAGYTSMCGSTTIAINPAAPNPTISATPNVLTLAQSVQLTWNCGTGTTVSVSGPGMTTSTACAGNNVPATPTAVGSAVYTIKSTNAGGTTTKSATVTVNAVPPPAPTISATPNVLTLGQSVQLTWNCDTGTTVSVSGPGMTTSTACAESNFSVTPTAVGTTAVYTITSTNAGGSASKSVTVTVAAAPLPNITSVTPSTVYLMDSNLLGNIDLNGSGFAAGDTLNITLFGDLTLLQGTDPDNVLVNLAFNPGLYSPGPYTFTVCENANHTKCGTPGTMLFFGAWNYLAPFSSGELASLDQGQGAGTVETGPATNGYVRKYSAAGVQESSCFVGSLKRSIAVDDLTGLVVVDGIVFNGAVQNDGTGNCDRGNTPYTQNLPTGTVYGTAARNGYTCFVKSANNAAYCYPLTGEDQVAFVTASNLGSDSCTIAMGVFGTETDAFISSCNGTPSLYKVRASDGIVEGQPLPLPGITPQSVVQAANPVAGGWQTLVFDSGPAAGTIVAFSAYDKLLLLIDENTWTVTQSVKLSGMPFRIAADVANGAVVVANATPGSSTTTYTSVDASSGVATPLTATSSLLSVGLEVSSDGTKIYSGQRNQLEVKQNQ